MTLKGFRPARFGRFVSPTGFSKSHTTKRRPSVQGASLIGALVGIAILTLVFAGGFMAIENDGTAAAVQASQAQATTVGDSILNLEQANPGCGNYTATGATTTGSSSNLGALSTWNTIDVPLGTGDGQWQVVAGSTWQYQGTGGTQNGDWHVHSATVTVIPGATYTLSGTINATNITSTQYVDFQVLNPGWSASYLMVSQAIGSSGSVSGTITIPSGVTQVIVGAQLVNPDVPAGAPVTFSQIQLSIVGTSSGANSQFTPCQIAVPAGEYYQASSDTAQPPQSLASCGSAPQVTTLNLEQASPSPWFCVQYSGQVLWGYTESSWVLPTSDLSVCPGSSGEGSAVPVAALLKRTVVLESQVLNQPVRTYDISRTTAPSIGAVPAGGASSVGLKSIMITGVPQGEFAELAMTVWTGGTGGSSQAQMLLTGAPNTQGQIFFPAIPADATSVEYWITATPSLQNPPSVASGTLIPSLSNTVTCEAG